MRVNNSQSVYQRPIEITAPSGELAPNEKGAFSGFE